MIQDVVVYLNVVDMTLTTLTNGIRMGVVAQLDLVKVDKVGQSGGAGRAKTLEVAVDVETNLFCKKINLLSLAKKIGNNVVLQSMIWCDKVEAEVVHISLIT